MPSKNKRWIRADMEDGTAEIRTYHYKTERYHKYIIKQNSPSMYRLTRAMTLNAMVTTLPHNRGWHAIQTEEDDNA